MTDSVRTRITAATRRDETTLRLGGQGDNWHMSWAADDSMVLSLCDGSGFPGTTRKPYNSRLYRVTGDPPDGVQFHDVPAYPELLSDSSTPGGFSRYYCFGTLALDGRIYQYLSTPNVPFDGANPRFVGAKLVYSPDDGTTWCNQDGSPLVWEWWAERSPENMAFFEEPQECFHLMTVLQMGRNYEHNRDGYVYAYAPNGNTDGAMNELVMFRVAKDRVLDRGAYEYFAGLRAGDAAWTADLDARGIVHTFPRGWVNTKVHPYSWYPSVVYNAPLGAYLMLNWGMGCAPDGMWFGKPSYLGVYVAETPWGPWEQIHEDTAWRPDGDANARAYQPQIAPKWIAPDGKSFWLVWTDFQTTGEGDEQVMPYYAFNVQRVDLRVG
jgi:hypothetical protein